MTLTRRLLLLALISVLPAIIIWTYTEVSLRRAREAEVTDLAIRQARLAASELERIFDGVQSLLLAVDETLSIKTLNAPLCSTYLQSLQRKVPHILSLVALDLNGLVRCRSGEPTDDGTRFTERSYFKDSLARQGFAVGEFTSEFVEGGLGPHPVLPLALPIWGDDGKIVGTIAAALDLRWLDVKLAERVLPSGGSVTIADRNGVIIAREPLPDRFVGTRIPEPFMKYVQGSGVGSFETVSQDGVKRILGYIPAGASSAGMFVSAGFSSKEAFSAINRAANRGFMIIAAALVLALSSSWLASRAFIAKPLEAMTHAVRAWRRGDYNARMDLRGAPGELGVLARAFNDLMDDLAERQRALQASEEHARLALEAGEMGTWWYDHLKGTGGWSSQAALLLGLSPDQTTTTLPAWLSLVHADDAEKVLANLRISALGDGDYEDEFRVVRPNGDARWINSKGRVFFDNLKRPVYFVGIFQDITARKQAENQQRLLLDELNHRVKNTLATVQSIAAQTQRTAPDPQKFRQAFEGRLMALSKTHDLLTRNSWRDADLHDIAEQELAPYRRDQDERVTIEGPMVNLPSRHAINFGLVLHELVTNAVKYGALSTAAGRLELRWSIVSQSEALAPELRLHWREMDGPVVKPSKHHGFGTRLIRRSIEGELTGVVTAHFAPVGVSYVIAVPL
ncbi:sensor histidine kinase [Microvirga brassicacearum]|uniref:Blue-light-activated histidine kinase n=1 Tax=Microvirga brassicacearum TaxID=2580413 RepID=A0A5N3P805_9HYPH|nr:HWE histidine kinase domain-containing protein [Microvirga brassicacearum]KAB0265857.1 PAS domain S-box protein [Microvirga brassicacearum]